jgi:sugar/nucleoside kinase (ribokinase family)
MSQETGKSPEVIVAGHICLDLLPTFDNEQTVSLSEMFVPGRLNHVGESVLSSGGTVSNTGIALRQLGFSTGLMAKIGRDLFGQGLMAILEDFKNGLQLIVDPDSSTSYSYVIAPPGVDRVFLHHPGANDTFCSDDLDYDSISSAKLFHFGYPPLMRKMYENDGIDLAKMMKLVRAQGVTTSLDMAYPDPDSPAGRANWQQVLNNTLPFTDIFLPSLEELLYMLDRSEFDRLVTAGRETGRSFISLFDMNRLPELADQVLSLGCAVVVIKLGYKGLFIKTASADRIASAGKAAPAPVTDWADKCWFAPSFLVEKIASTTGAGDASIAGFISGVLAGKPSWQALQLGCAAAAQKIQIRKSYGGIDTIDKLQAKIEDWPHEQVPDIPASWIFEQEKRIWQIG